MSISTCIIADKLPTVHLGEQPAPNGLRPLTVLCRCGCEQTAYARTPAEAAEQRRIFGRRNCLRHRTPEVRERTERDRTRWRLEDARANLPVTGTLSCWNCSADLEFPQWFKTANAHGLPLCETCDIAIVADCGHLAPFGLLHIDRDDSTACPHCHRAELRSFLGLAPDAEAWEPWLLEAAV